MWDFNRHYLLIDLESIAILTLLKLPIYEHKMSFNLFRSFLKHEPNPII